MGRKGQDPGETLRPVDDANAARNVFRVVYALITVLVESTQLEMT